MSTQPESHISDEGSEGSARPLPPGATVPDAATDEGASRILNFIRQARSEYASQSASLTSFYNSEVWNNPGLSRHPEFYSTNLDSLRQEVDNFTKISATQSHPDNASQSLLRLLRELNEEKRSLLLNNGFEGSAPWPLAGPTSLDEHHLRPRGRDHPMNPHIDYYVTRRWVELNQEFIKRLDDLESELTASSTRKDKPLPSGRTLGSILDTASRLLNRNKMLHGR